MMRIVGILTTAAMLFVIGFGAGGYFVGRLAYIEGAKAAFIRCYEKSGEELEASQAKPDHQAVHSG